MNPDLSIADLERSITAELDLVMPRPERVEADCGRLRGSLSKPPSGSDLERLRRLASILERRTDSAVEPLWAVLEEAVSSAPDPWPLLQGMLAARREALALRALELTARRACGGELPVDRPVVQFLAERADAEGSVFGRPEGLAQIALILRSAPPGPDGPADPALALYLADREGALRRLGARVLDLPGTPVPPERAAQVLGSEAHAALDGYLRYSRATHLDLLHLAPEPGIPPACLDSFRRAEDACGVVLLREAVAAIGWPRLNLGIEARPRIGVSLAGSLPLWIEPAEAPVFQVGREARRVAERFLIVAHGGIETKAGETRPRDDPVLRFRAYNLAHAELLAEILEMEPLTPEKVERILGRMDGLVEDFIALFTPFTRECAILPDVYGSLKTRILAGLCEEHPRPSLSADLTRRVQMFEDPDSLAAVNTLHGLKRYLHQQGLKLGFRLVEGGRGTNRSVTIVLTSGTRVLRALTGIEYANFEVDAAEGLRDAEAPAPGPDLPYPVSVLVDGFGLALLHGQERFPDAKVFCYGNEVHYYLTFANHPAFLRVDYAPPLQGGMIDLEYYGVSKYVLSEHPDPELHAALTFFRRLDFDSRVQNTRVKARYDKERAVDLAELCERAEAVFRLVPHLMDLDWAVGDLSLPEEARRAAAEAWAARFEHWGVVPMNQVLSPDRRGIRLRSPSDRGGESEPVWDGTGEYRDRFPPLPPTLATRLHAWLTELGLDPPPLPEAETSRWGQIDLERHVLRPLRAAAARGEILPGPRGPARRSRDLFQREHEAEAFAAILDGPLPQLAAAARLAGFIGFMERSVRFRTTGSVNGCDVERAHLKLRGDAITLFVLRDPAGMARLAFYAHGEALWRRREHPREPWRFNRVEDATALASLLRRNGYLPRGASPPGEAPRADAVREAMRRSAARREHRPAPGERVVSGLRITPGRTVGAARFGTSGRAPAELDGAVLVASSVRPEDAPFLYRAAGIVSTGGSTLSHAALLAAQFRKPALLIPGSWRTDPGGAPALAYRVLEYSEDMRMHGEWRVTVRRGLREREYLLREGDLLALDADACLLRVLGQDRDVLALHEELRRLGDASRRLARTGGGESTLEIRGLRLRAAHQLEKLLGRLSDPALARHAAQEILLGEDLEGELALEKARLLSFLFGNPQASETAKEFLRGATADLARRYEDAREAALGRIPASASLHELLGLRLQVVRLRHATAGAAQALHACGLARTGSAPADASDLDALVRGRLACLRRERAKEAERAAAGGTAPLRHLLRQLRRIDEVIGASDSDRRALDRMDSDLNDADEAARHGLEGRRVLGHRECGFEVFDRIGWKAANLGEVERLTGAGRVPEWFVVTHEAFEEVLRTRLDPAETEGFAAGAEPPTLGEAIESVLARSDLDDDQRSVRIRRLWDRIQLPAPLAEAVRTAYRELAGGAAGRDGGAPAEEAGAFVAVRSSAREEDTEAAARAGEFDTFLFVRGEEAVLAHLKRAFGGLWGARAIKSRRLLGPGPGRVGGGVIVQRIVDSRVSGVLQTVNVAEGELAQMVVNAGLGLGEGVVSGAVAADHAVVEKGGRPDHGPLRFRYVTTDKRERVVFDRRSGSGTVRTECLYHQRLRPALEYTELCELTAMAARLEAAYGYPLDIEFALEGERLWILQARPVPAYRAVLRETLERHPLAGSSAPAPSIVEEEIRP